MSEIGVKGEVKVCDGNRAGAYGVLLSQPDVVAIYPITPQTSLVEYLAQFKADGVLRGDMVEVEGEISAMGVAIGAAACGGRTFTSTSSMGLAFMNDTYLMAGFSRLPIVMVNANREMSPPGQVSAGQQDIMGVADSGWIYIHVESCQEILDSIIMSYRLSEDPEVSLPVTVAYDGFYLSYLCQPVEIPPAEKVAEFLPRIQRPSLTITPPTGFIGFALAGADTAEYRYLHQEALERVKQKIDDVDKEFEAMFGRSYGGQMEEYRMEDAEIVLISMGSHTGTARVTVDRMRNKGIKVGLVKIRLFRPFPREKLVGILKDKRAVGIIDRSVCFGWNSGHLVKELKAALYEAKTFIPLADFIDGLGGGDITIENLERAIQITHDASLGRPFKETTWLQIE